MSQRRSKVISGYLAPVVLVGIGCSGCFSGTLKHGEAMGGPAPGTGEKVIAAAADVATMPVQATLYAASGPVLAQQGKAQRDEMALLQRIEADPEVIFRENLHTSRARSARGAVSRALWDPKVPFTDSQLRRLFAELDGRKYDVLRNPNCSLAFLREIAARLPHMEPAERAQHIQFLCSNPRVPRTWLEQWAENPAFTGNGAAFAKSELARRKANKPQ